MPHALIQIVSEQTLPNILPVLAAPPTALTLIYTPRVQPQVDWILTAVHKAGLDPQIHQLCLTGTVALRETAQAVMEGIAHAQAAGLDPVINFTGGTKLMSIGAVAAAQRTKVASFYFESVPCRCTSGDSGPLPAALEAHDLLDRIQSRLTVEVMLAAQGIEITSPGRDPAPWLPLGRALAGSKNLERACHDFVQRLRSPHPRSPQDYLQLLQSPLDDIPNGIIEASFLAGAIVEREGHWYLACEQAAAIERWAQGASYEPTAFFEAIQGLNDYLNLLDGGWWELHVWEKARHSGQFNDLRWSMVVQRPGSHQGIEEDLIGLHGLQLAVFSCKRGGEQARLLRAFEELEAAARTLGGSQTQRYLCIAMPIALSQFEEVRARAATSRTHLIGPADRIQAHSFQPQP